MGVCVSKESALSENIGVSRINPHRCGPALTRKLGKGPLSREYVTEKRDPATHAPAFCQGHGTHW